MANKIIVSFTIIGALSLLSGCSLFKRKTVENKEETKTIPLVKYQELLTSYKELQLKYEESLNKTPTLAAEGPKSAPLAETVDLSENSSKDSIPIPKETGEIVEKGTVHEDFDGAVNGAISGAIDEVQIEETSVALTQALALFERKQYGEAMKELQLLEDSPYKQIRVRAKYYIGEILREQKEYDLAMQVYEVIVNEYAFSGLALNSLERLALCAKELGLKAKHERYQSLLQQFLNGGSLSPSTP